MDSPITVARSGAISWTPLARVCRGQIPMLENCPPYNEDGASVMHMYMPWWLYQDQHAGRLDFPRGYHIEFGGGRRMPEAGTFDDLENFTGGSYGKKFKADVRRYYGSFMGFAGRGEMIPNEDSLLRN